MLRSQGTQFSERRDRGARERSRANCGEFYREFSPCQGAENFAPAGVLNPVSSVVRPKASYTSNRCPNLGRDVLKRALGMSLLLDKRLKM